MNEKISLLLIFISSLLAACLPEPLDVDGLPVIKPQIVVSSQIIPDQSLVVLLTKTFGALDASDDTDPSDLMEMIGVNDAVVTIEGPDGIDSLVMISNGVYGGVLIPFVPGQQYTLNIKSESLGTVRSTTTVQSPVTFQAIEAELFFNGFDDTLAQISYAIQDPPEKNYYMLNVQEVEQEDLVENILNPRAFTRLVDDTNFNGQHFNETFKVVPRDYNPGDTIAVSLSNVSPEFYHFMQLRADNRFNFLQYLSEPVNYPTNVEGGKGFFNLYIPDFRVFELDSL